MKYVIWVLGAVIIISAASCSLLNPTATQVTVQVSNQSGSSCPVTVNLDGNTSQALIVATGTYQTFPLVNAGSHTLNFSTGNYCTAGGTCMFYNTSTPASTYSATFNTTGGNVYVGTIKQSTAANNNCNQLIESGP